MLTVCQGGHALEAVLVKKYLGKGALAWMVLGQIAPDLFTKVLIFNTDNAWEAQKLPPLGLTHTPFLHLLLGCLIFLVLRHREQASLRSTSYVVGAWTHIIMDAGDPYGVMLYYPFSEHLFKWREILGVDLWAYGNEYSGAVDARMYFMSWGLLIEAFFLLSVLPILPMALARSEFNNPIEYILTFTFVIYGAALFFILSFVPVMLAVPIPQEYDPVFKWGTISTFSGDSPQSAANAQWILGLVMGTSFLLCLSAAVVRALRYYSPQTWPSSLRRLLNSLNDFIPYEEHESGVLDKTQ